MEGPNLGQISVTSFLIALLTREREREREIERDRETERENLFFNL